MPSGPSTLLHKGIDMSQVPISFPSPTCSGVQLIARLLELFESAISNRLGDVRPSDVQFGETWVDSSAAPVLALKMWTGTDDAQLLTVNTETGAVGIDASAFGGQPPAYYAAAAHNHAGVYEPVFAKSTGFNKNFATEAQAVAGVAEDVVMNPLNVFQAFTSLINQISFGADYLTWPSVMWNTPGTYDWTVPDNVTQAVAEVCAPGGGSGSSINSTGTDCGTAGGYGAYICGLVTLTPGAIIPVTVGAPGTGGVRHGAAATSGGLTSFGGFLSSTGGLAGTSSVGQHGYALPGVATCSTSDVVLLAKSVTKTSGFTNNGPQCMEETTALGQSGKSYGGGASGSYSNMNGHPGGPGFVRVWYLED